MAGIPVHTASPINPHTAAKATGITPTTSSPASQPSGAATTTSTATSNYAPAQPGAAPPQPTASLSNPIPPPPTRTTNPPTTTSTSDPPPPQPGAIPTPFAATAQSYPAPPAPGATPSTYQPPTATPTRSYQPAPLPPHQQPTATINNPDRAQPPAGTTSSFAPATDLSHPPGYIQDSRTSFEDMPVSKNDPYDNLTGPSRRNGSGAGILDGVIGSGSGEAVDGVWNTAVSWAKAAGQKLSEGEEQIWKSINREK